MPLPLIALAAAAVPELVKMGVGLGQKVKSNRLIKNNKRPTLNYPIPSEYYENMMAAKNMAGVSGLPGQGQIENRMDAQGANAISLASQTQQSPVSIMAGVSAMSNNLMGAEADLGVKGAEFKAKNLAEYFRANEQLAGAELNKFNNDWDWNQSQPYLSAMSAASALREGGAQNAFSGLEGLSTLATSFFADKLKKGAAESASESGKYPGTPPFVPTLQYPDTWLDSSRVDNAPDSPTDSPFDFQNDLWKSKEGQPWAVGNIDDRKVVESIEPPTNPMPPAPPQQAPPSLKVGETVETPSGKKMTWDGKGWASNIATTSVKGAVNTVNGIVSDKKESAATKLDTWISDSRGLGGVKRNSALEGFVTGGGLRPKYKVALTEKAAIKKALGLDLTDLEQKAINTIDDKSLLEVFHKLNNNLEYFAKDIGISVDELKNMIIEAGNPFGVNLK